MPEPVDHANVLGFQCVGITSPPFKIVLRGLVANEAPLVCPYLWGFALFTPPVPPT